MDNFIPPTARMAEPDPEESKPKYARVKRIDPNLPFNPQTDTLRCPSCSAWGKHLLHPYRKSMYCASCIRREEFKPLPDDSNSNLICDIKGGKSYSNFYDITYLSDGGVLKRDDYSPPIHTLDADEDTSSYDDDDTFVGDSSSKSSSIYRSHLNKHPTEGCPVRIHYVSSRRLPVIDIFDTTRDTSLSTGGMILGGGDDVKEFYLLREKVIKGYDLAVASMVPNEVSTFIIRGKDYGYGMKSVPESLPKLRVGDDIVVEIELVGYGKSIPRFPSVQELEETKAKRDKEAEEELKLNPPLPYSERCDLAVEEKDKGNTQFQLGNYQAAKQLYDSAFVNIFIHRDEWPLLSKAHKEQITKLKSTLHLNRCAARLKMENFTEAAWDADRAVEFDPENPKGYFRRGLVYSGFLAAELAKENTGVFWDVIKARKLSLQSYNDFERSVELNNGVEEGAVKKGRRTLAGQDKMLMVCEKNYNKEQKKLYKEKMMGSLNDKYESMKVKSDKRKNERDAVELEDMTPLEENGDDGDEDDFEEPEFGEMIDLDEEDEVLLKGEENEEEES